MLLVCHLQSFFSFTHAGTWNSCLVLLYELFVCFDSNIFEDNKFLNMKCKLKSKYNKNSNMKLQPLLKHSNLTCYANPAKPEEVAKLDGKETKGHDFTSAAQCSIIREWKWCKKPGFISSFLIVALTLHVVEPPQITRCQITHLLLLLNPCCNVMKLFTFNTDTLHGHDMTSRCLNASSLQLSGHLLQVKLTLVNSPRNQTRRWMVYLAQSKCVTQIILQLYKICLKMKFNSKWHTIWHSTSSRTPVYEVQKDFHDHLIFHGVLNDNEKRSMHTCSSSEYPTHVGHYDFLAVVPS